MDEGLCKLEPDPIFFYPIPHSTFSANALLKITCTANHKVRYKIRYGNKHPKMIVQISEESEGTLRPGQCLGIEISLMPGYDVMEHEADSFKIMVWAIPVPGEELQAGAEVVRVLRRSVAGQRENTSAPRGLNSKLRLVWWL